MRACRGREGPKVKRSNTETAGPAQLGVRKEGEGPEKTWSRVELEESVRDKLEVGGFGPKWVMVREDGEGSGFRGSSTGTEASACAELLRSVMGPKCKESEAKSAEPK